MTQQPGGHGSIVLDRLAATSPRIDESLRSIRRVWKQQTSARIEDEVVESNPGSSVSRLVVPVVAPILLIPSILLLREPGNSMAAMTLIIGCIALVYSAVASWVERRLASQYWVALAHAIVYSVIISSLLWTFATFEHPRAHLHWIIFFLYFLMIGANGLSDDPRHPFSAGCVAIASYSLVVIALRLTAATGASPMAERVIPEFEWVANSAKIFLLIGTTVLATASAARGRELRRASLRDGLTGLLNRHAFDQCLEHLARRAERNSQVLSVAMIDIDHFKDLNDTYGHPTGDDVLRFVALTLQQSFRTSDLVARYGGEEFVVAFPDADHQRISERLEHVRSAVSTRELRSRGGEHALRVTVSIGAARFPVDGPTVHDVLGRADERLYLAKNHGRDRVVLESAKPAPA